jgi:hypothetical protein
VHFGFIEGLVVGSGGQDQQIGATVTACDEVVGHRQAEEAVVVSLNDENGESAFAENFFRGPDGWNQRRKKSGDPCGACRFAERGIACAEDEAISFYPIENGGSDTGSEGESEYGDRDLWGELPEELEGRDRIDFALSPVNGASAAAIAGVVEDE